MLSTISSRPEINSSLEILKSKGVHIDSCIPSDTEFDITDNPAHSESSISESNIFKLMKYECNRLYSFQNKWPIQEISPESLAEAGLFYLQQEDKVQCPFCHIILFNWTCGDNPLREHMRRRPKCPFLMGSNVGNIPISHKNREMPLKSSTSSVPERNCSSQPQFLYKPKHPRMTDIKRRLLTYSGWPVRWLKPQQLSECGLYYSGIADVVTCFFCGGSLGNWEPNDDPWNEHRKFFPDCAFLSAAENKGRHSTKVSVSCEEKQTTVHRLNSDSACEMSSFDITSDLIREAQDIFPEDEILESLQRKGGNVHSLHELCDDILEMRQEQKEDATSLIPGESEPKASISSSTSPALLCVICMDKERGIAYQPCGHFVSCVSCATKINNCPMCRKPIIHKMRIYHT